MPLVFTAKNKYFCGWRQQNNQDENKNRYKEICIIHGKDILYIHIRVRSRSLRPSIHSYWSLWWWPGICVGYRFYDRFLYQPIQHIVCCVFVLDKNQRQCFNESQIRHCRVHIVYHTTWYYRPHHWCNTYGFQIHYENINDDAGNIISTNAYGLRWWADVVYFKYYVFIVLTIIYIIVRFSKRRASKVL